MIVEECFHKTTDRFVSLVKHTYRYIQINAAVVTNKVFRLLDDFFAV